MGTVRTVHRAKLEDIRPSPFRYSRVGTPMDRKLAYVLAKRGQTRAILVRDISLSASPENPVNFQAGEEARVELDGPKAGILSKFSHYEIVDGHRVYDAMRAIGAKTCTVVSVGEVDDLEALLIAIEHNESRGPIDHVDLARAFKVLAESGLAPAEIAARIDFDEEQVRLYQKLLDFDVESFSKGGESGQVEFMLEPEAEELR